MELAKMKKEDLELLSYKDITYYILEEEGKMNTADLFKKFSLEGHKILIISSDGDFTQLHKYPNVKQWSPMHKK